MQNNSSTPVEFKLPTKPTKNTKRTNALKLQEKMHDFSRKPMPRIEKFIDLSDDQLKVAFTKEFLPACLTPNSPFSTKTHDQLQQLFIQLVSQERKKMKLNQTNL